MTRSHLFKVTITRLGFRLGENKSERAWIWVYGKIYHPETEGLSKDLFDKNI